MKTQGLTSWQKAAGAIGLIILILIGVGVYLQRPQQTVFGGGLSNCSPAVSKSYGYACSSDTTIPCFYTIYKDTSGNFLAKNGQNGQDDYSSMTFDTTLANAINNLDAGRANQEWVCLKGDFPTLTTAITIPAFTGILLQGRVQFNEPASTVGFDITGKRVDITGGYWLNQNTGAGQDTFHMENAAGEQRIYSLSMQGGRVAIAPSSAADVQVNNVYFTGANNAVSGRSTARLSITSSTFVNSNDNEIDITGTQFSIANNIIRDTQATPTTLNGIYIAGEGSTGSITDNLIQGTSLAGIRVVSTTAAPKGILINGNRLFDNGKTTPNGDDGIIVDGSTNAITGTIVSNNYIEKTGENGVHLNTVSGGVISGNVILDSGTKTLANQQNCIRLDNPSYGPIVLDNRCFDDQATKTQQWAYFMAGAPINVTIADNDFANNAKLQPINLSGGISKTTFILNNIGFNPQGAITNFVENTGNTANPLNGVATPTSATTYTVAVSPMLLIIIGGTVTAIVVNGKTIASSATTETLDLWIGDTFSVTFSVVPTWQASFH